MLLSEARKAGARLKAACEVLGLSPRTVERWVLPGQQEDRRCGPRRSPPNKLTAHEKAKVLSLLHSEQFRDLPPAQVVVRLADDGQYLASESTMYRLLRAQEEATRRDGARPHLMRSPRRHVATAPNQVWCWDITLVPKTVKGTFFYVYLVIDLFSRRVMGFEVRESESALAASELIRRLCLEHEVDSAKLVLHSDNGNAMKGQTMLATLRWLGITPSFSRPYVSDDNAYVEAVFKTLKYRPSTPARFDQLANVTAWVTGFVRWYNHEHRHSGIRYVTPEQRYRGQDVTVLAAREGVYTRARTRHPERWIGPTRDWSRPHEVRLNHANALAADNQVAA
jgi:transposase InsO family protein